MMVLFNLIRVCLEHSSYSSTFSEGFPVTATSILRCNSFTVSGFSIKKKKEEEEKLGFKL
jgi:putative component of membrane protein insertase Oxa1/YidC/SpoIIIJ protein YidD